LLLQALQVGFGFIDSRLIIFRCSQLDNIQSIDQALLQIFQSGDDGFQL